MYEFTVPDGDWDYDNETDEYHFKNLTFVEATWGAASDAMDEFRREGTAFTMNYTPKR